MQEFKPELTIYDGLHRTVVEGRLDGFGTVVVKRVKDLRHIAEVERLRQEFLLLEGVSHPNWAEPLAFRHIAQAEMPVSPGIVMRRAPGATLSNLRVRPGWNPQKLEIARQILAALDSLHRLGYVHLDLHPEQVLIEIPDHSAQTESEPDVRVTLLDLGLAAGRATRITRRGTLGFIAPEVFLAKQTTAQPQADLFCFGLLLHYLVAGVFPVEGVSDQDKSRAHARGVEPNLGGNAPAPLVALVSNLLSPLPEIRSASATQVWQEMRETINDIDHTRQPPRLTRTISFPFRARGRETREFQRALELFERSPGRLRTWQFDGEPGIGKKRLITRLAAHAQLRGWELSASADRCRIELRREGKTIELRAGFPQGRAEVIAGESESSVTVHELRPLPEDELQRMVRGNLFETEALVKASTALSLGNPGLLASLVGRLPEFLDLAGPHLEAIGIERQVDPPSFWIEWVRSLPPRGGDAASPGAGQRTEGESGAQLLPSAQQAFLAVSLAGRAIPAEGIEAAFGWSPGFLRKVLGPWIERQCILDDGEHVSVSSRLWSRAIESADPEMTRDLGTRLLSSHPPVDGPGSVELARMAFRVRDGASFWKLLPRAMEYLTSADRIEDVLELGCDAFNQSQSDQKPLSNALAEQILMCVTFLGTSQGVLLPEWMCDREPPGLEGSPLGKLLRAWACTRYKRFEDAWTHLEDLGGDPESTNLSLARLTLRVLVHVRLNYEGVNERLRWIDEASENPRFQAPQVSYQVRRLQRPAVSFSADMTRMTRLFQEYPASVAASWGPARRAQRSLDAAETFAKQQPLTELQNALELWSQLGCLHLQAMARSALGGHLFELGQLERSLQVNRLDLAWELSRPSGTHSGPPMYNIAAALTFQGRLPVAIEAARRAEYLSAERTVSFPAELCRGFAALILAHGGHSAEAFRIADELVQSSSAMKAEPDPLWLEARGMARFRLGRRGEAVGDIEEAYERFLRKEEFSDALNALSTRLQLETETGLREDAMETWKRIHNSRAELTPLIARRFELLEEELRWLEWIPFDERAQEPPAVSPRYVAPDGSLWQLYQWQPWWRRAAWERRRGRIDLADKFYGTAGSKLLDVTSFTLDSRFADSYLRLPAPDAFLLELEEWRGSGEMSPIPRGETDGS